MEVSRSNIVYSSARVVSYAYAFTFLEWLFFVTKPSFLSQASVPAQLGALLVGALPFVLGALAVHLVLLAAAFGFSRLRVGWTRRVIPVLFVLVPSVIAAATALMLADNFTYTMFGWGVVRANAWVIPLYLVALCAVVFFHVRRSLKVLAVRAQGPVSRLRLRFGSAVGLVILSGLALGVTRASASVIIDAPVTSARAGKLPNILFFASDGVTASHTSAYGNTRKTTPNLDRYLDRALVADNAFTNSGWTTGSVTSMMTGKYPATTKLLYPPYTLQGVDAYQSLPRMLRSLGYRGIQETVRYYADGPDLNWREAFDAANDRVVKDDGALSFGAALQLPATFFDQMSNRLAARVKHLLFIQKMVDAHALVTDTKYAKVYGISDESRIDRVIDFIDQGDGPFFAHIHLMETHCCGFRPEHPTFSVGEFDDKKAKKDAAFDDTILESDELFGRVMDHLEERHLLENTIVVYSSDHTSGWDFREQVPLVFLFPGGEHHGHLTAPAQLLDVAPTLLDYLKVPIPEWMEGRSLLRDGLDPMLPVYAISQLSRGHFKNDGERLARVTKLGPPTWGLSVVGMVVCQRWYTMSLKDRKVKSGAIRTYKGECPEDRLPDSARAAEMMSGYLKARGFSF